MINSQTKVVILTGAGISAESGIRTFRAADGLWEEHRIEDVATPEGWIRNPELVWNFYQGRRRQLLEVVPNPAHNALVTLEKHLEENLLLITQNVRLFESPVRNWSKSTLEREQKWLESFL